MPYNGGNASSTLSLAIDSNGDIGGNYTNSTGGTQQAFVYISGTSYTLNPPSNNTGPPTVTALNTQGQAVGWLTAGSPPTHFADVWSYTISGGTTTRSPTRTFNSTGGSPPHIPVSRSSQALAINNSGMVVVGACNA